MNLKYRNPNTFVVTYMGEDVVLGERTFYTNKNFITSKDNIHMFLASLPENIRDEMIYAEVRGEFV